MADKAKMEELFGSDSEVSTTDSPVPRIKTLRVFSLLIRLSVLCVLAGGIGGGGCSRAAAGAGRHV